MKTVVFFYQNIACFDFVNDVWISFWIWNAILYSGHKNYGLIGYINNLESFRILISLCIPHKFTIVSPFLMFIILFSVSIKQILTTTEKITSSARLPEQLITGEPINPAVLIERLRGPRLIKTCRPSPIGPAETRSPVWTNTSIDWSTGIG